MLVELGVVEQRYRAVLEVLEEGRRSPRWPAVMVWRGRRCMSGWPLCAGRAGRAGGPVVAAGVVPHQMPAAIEARIVSMRRDHPGWGPSRIVWELERARVVPLPGRSAVYRALIRHGLVDPKKRKRRREDYRRWERPPGDGLVADGCDGPGHLAGGAEVKIVTGIDDHSRFVVCAKAVMRATARPVCQALTEALRRHGIPGQILTDNGKVFTAPVRPGAGPGHVRPDLR